MRQSETSSDSAPYELLDSDWERIGEILEAFSLAWEQKPPIPEITPFVDSLASGPLRRLTLIELIKFDMESRAGTPDAWKPLSEYQQQWPELCRQGNLPSDLVFEAYQIRRHRFGDSESELETSADAFPGGISALSRLVRSTQTQTGRSTALIRAPRKIQLDAGDQIDEFDLLLKLGAGGFGTVFLARQNSMRRLVALKVTTDEGVEPQMLAQLDHPHIVRVFDQRPAQEGQLWLMYMQYIAGASLAELHRELRTNSRYPSFDGASLVGALDGFLVDRGESIPVQSPNRDWLKAADGPAVICHIGQQIADALGYAQAQGILHRDLKPANVLLDAHGNVKLVDFNVSSCTKLDGVDPANHFGGSLAYMSLEQLEACSPWHDRLPDELTDKTDIYSLGVTLFELLTGSRPFQNSSAQDMSSILDELIRQRKAGLNDHELARLDSQPLLLQQLLLRMLSSAPSARPTAEKARQALAWSSTPGGNAYLGSTQSKVAPLAERWSIAIVCLLTVCINAAAAVFITTYNLMESVPTLAQGYFENVLRFTNAALFSVGGWIVVWLTYPIADTLRKIRQQTGVEAETLQFATQRNWNLGHRIAVMCILQWSLAGFFYPLILTVSQIPIPLSGWFDFISSHLIAGLIAGAYTFWSISCCSLKYWHPRFMLASLQVPSVSPGVQPIDRTRRRMTAYQVIAVAMPLLAIAWLIWWGKAENRFALGVVTGVALLGLGFLVWAVNQTHRLLQLIERLETR